jgi:hypothetical protein
MSEIISRKSNIGFQININNIVTIDQLNHGEVSKLLKENVLNYLFVNDISEIIDEDELRQNSYNSISDLDKDESSFYVLKSKVPVNVNGKYGYPVYNLITDYDVNHGSWFFDFMFVYKITQLSIFEIDTFLDFHLNETYSDNFKYFARYLKLCIRGYKKNVLNEDIIDTITEWISLNEEIYGSLKSNKLSPVTWTLDKTDFVKLIYALYYAKYLNKGEGHITKITAYLAPHFNIVFKDKDNTLSSSLSNSNKRGHQMFDFIKEIEKGFNEYLDTLKK